MADTAVAEFCELRETHDRVVQLRLQRDHLTGLRTASDDFDAASRRAEIALRSTDAVVPYQRHRTLQLAADDLESSLRRLLELDARAEQAESQRRHAEDRHESAQRRERDLGGAETEYLTQRLHSARAAEQDTEQRWQRFRDQLAVADITQVPHSAAEFAELVAEIDRTLKADRPEGTPVDDHARQERYFRAKSERDRLEAEITSVRVTGTMVPRSLLDVRSALVGALGLPLLALPFAAETIDILPEHSRWTGAIERVLRPFALTMLVRPENLVAVRRWVDSHQISTRFVFEAVSSDGPPPRPARSSQSLVRRVTVATGPFHDWVVGQLAERFDYACVEDVDELDDHVRAVTVNGQVKSSRTRYEKDDRVALNDRAAWVLGDPEAKLEALADRLVLAKREFAAAELEASAAAAARDAAVRRRTVLEALRTQSWRDVDRASARQVVSSLEGQLDELLRGRGDLEAAVREVEAASAARRQADVAYEDARLALLRERELCEDLRRVVEEIETDLETGALLELHPDVQKDLDVRFRQVQRSITRQNLAEIGQEVLRVLQRERDTAQEAARGAANELTRLAVQFNERWEAAAVDLTPSLADRTAYIELLDQIIAHRLPDHEQNFLRLLKSRSQDLIGTLVNAILRAPREIEERIRPVNDSLLRSPFDAGRFLRLRPKVRRSETVTRFIAELRSVSDGVWSDDDLDSMEQRFVTLAELMRKFGSSDQVDRSWRTQCLDTRLHVTFLAEEIDESGRAHATYDSGAAMSGGQQQKLVIFCLAAALRYQLADTDAVVPSYGTIVLDEAFDKADSRYTRMALDVFREFGFHLVLATPQKLLQTIEPYVGAATSIENPSRMRSEISEVSWED